MNRRNFLLTAASLAAAGTNSRCSLSTTSLAFTGQVLGASHHVGHLLREGRLPAPKSRRKVPVVIVGAGMAGLSAGWKLQKAGFNEFEILELEPACGGNSRFGENHITPYPWGAHYVPLPTRESGAVRELFEEFGIIQEYTAAGEPKYEEKYLCFSPQERLYRYGRWQEGLLPLLAASKKDLEQYGRFRDLMAHYRGRRGRDGRKAFAIPMELSSRDREFLALDQTSMHDFLIARGLDSPALHWYANYACRDDYGTNYSEVSAWAGVHYFASRDGGGKDEIEGSSVLTWPEGNGWIVKRLASLLTPHFHTNALVFRVSREKTSASVDYFDVQQQRSTRVEAEQVILACPRQFAESLLAGPGVNPASWLAEFEYAPWMVANLSLREFPRERAGAPLAWDNVIYDSPSLGYVVATHQSLRTHIPETVFTYYYPMTDAPPRQERNRLLATTWQLWADFIIEDLGKPHPEISQIVSKLDIFRWGHAMVRPKPGFLWGQARSRAAKSVENIHFAHSDLSGFSIFEEAQYRGVVAAEKALELLRVGFTSSL